MNKIVPEMTEEERIRSTKCVEAWKRAGPELERLRREDIRQVDTIKSMPAFDGAFESAVSHFPPQPTSGLIEQQRLFGVLLKNDQAH